MLIQTTVAWVLGAGDCACSEPGVSAASAAMRTIRKTRMPTSYARAGYDSHVVREYRIGVAEHPIRHEPIVLINLIDVRLVNQLRVIFGRSSNLFARAVDVH